MARPNQCTIGALLTDPDLTDENRAWLNVFVTTSPITAVTALFGFSGWVVNNHRRGIKGGYSTGCRCLPLGKDNT